VATLIILTYSRETPEQKKANLYKDLRSLPTASWQTTMLHQLALRRSGMPTKSLSRAFATTKTPQRFRVNASESLKPTVWQQQPERVVLFKIGFPIQERRLWENFQWHGKGLKKLCHTLIDGLSPLRGISIKHHAGAVLLPSEDDARRITDLIQESGSSSLGAILEGFSDVEVPIQACLKSEGDRSFGDISGQLDNITCYREIRRLLHVGHLEEGLGLWWRQGAPISLAPAVVVAHQTSLVLPSDLDNLRDHLRTVGNLTDSQTKKRIESRDLAYFELFKLLRALKEHDLMEVRQSTLSYVVLS